MCCTASSPNNMIKAGIGKLMETHIWEPVWSSGPGFRMLLCHRQSAQNPRIDRLLPFLFPKRGRLSFSAFRMAFFWLGSEAGEPRSSAPGAYNPQLLHNSSHKAKISKKMMAIRPSMAIIFLCHWVIMSHPLELAAVLCCNCSCYSRDSSQAQQHPTTERQEHTDALRCLPPASSTGRWSNQRHLPNEHAARWYLISSCSLVTHQSREHPHDPKISSKTLPLQVWGQFLKLRAARLDVVPARSLGWSKCHQCLMSPVALKCTDIYAEIFSLNHESLLNHLKSPLEIFGTVFQLFVGVVRWVDQHRIAAGSCANIAKQWRNTQKDAQHLCPDSGLGLGPSWAILGPMLPSSFSDF